MSEKKTRPTLLVIDDNDVDRVTITRLLGGDFCIYEASTAAGGLAAMEKERPACILLDYRLPDKDGLELIQTFVSAGVPVIMLSGKGAEEVAVAAVKAGASDYFVKERLDKLTLSRAIFYAIDNQLLRTRVLQREAELEDKDRQMFRILDAVPIGIFALDSSGSPYYSNQRATEMLGMGVGTDTELAETVTTYPSFRAGTDVPYPLEEMPIVQALRGLSSQINDCEIADASGQRTRILATGAPIFGKDGTIEYALATFDDITDQMRLEAQYLQSQKMEAVGRLAGGVAHDFNNLLTAIFSFGRFVMESLEPNSQAAQDMAEVLGAADRAESLTRQLLAFSRKQTVQPRITELNSLVSELDRMLRRTLGEQVELRTKLSATPWPVRIDPGVFDQVILNLCINARDAMPEGGNIVIESYNQFVCDEIESISGTTIPHGDYVVLVVSDDGMGMTADTQEKIFEPFFTTKPTDRGTGLGLSTCYGIVKQAGGYFTLHSERHVGSTFTIYLPSQRGDVAEERPGHSSLSPPKGTETILVVEDDEAVRRIVVRVLERGGYHVLEACDYDTAIARQESFAGTIELLLTDLVMPGTNGRALAKKMVGFRTDLKVLFMSGYADNIVSAKEVLEPGVSLLQKPFSPTTLLTAVREILDTSANQNEPAHEPDLTSRNAD